MRELIEKLKNLFRKRDCYYLVLVVSKYVQEDIGQETYVAGYLFDTYEDALKHKMDIDKNNESVSVLGIERFKTRLDVTYAKLDYTRGPGHPNPSVVFRKRI